MASASEQRLPRGATSQCVAPSRMSSTEHVPEDSQQLLFELRVIKKIYRDNPGNKKKFSSKFPRRAFTVFWRDGIHPVIPTIY